MGSIPADVGLLSKIQLIENSLKKLYLKLKNETIAKIEVKMEGMNSLPSQ